MEYRTTNNAATLAEHVRMAQVLLPCSDLAATLAFFTDRLGFKVNLIFPADKPRTAVVSGHGLTLRLETGIHQHEAIGLYELTGFQRIPPFGDYREDPLSLFFERCVL